MLIRRVIVVVKPAAESDLDEILSRLELEGGAVRSQLNTAFFDRFDKLLTTGSALRFRPEFGRDVRVAKFKSWLIFFCLTEKSVVILRVLQGHRHPKANQAKVSKS